MSGVKQISLALLLVGALLVGAGVAHAQQTAGVKVTPPIIEEKVDPSETLSYTITIENESDMVQDYFPFVRNITGIGASGEPIFEKVGEESDYGLASWIVFSNKTYHVLPRQSVKMDFSVSVPKNVSPGTHVGLVGVSTEPPENAGIGSSVSYQVGSIVSLRVAGDIVENVKLREFKSGRTIYSVPDLELGVRVENLGNVFMRPQGFIDIKNMWGRKVETLPVNDGGGSVFPKSERTYTSEWKSEEFEFGKYTAELSLVVEGASGVQTLTAKLDFWVLPTRVIFPVLGGLLVFILIFYILLRFYIRSQIMRATKGRVVRKSDTATLSRLSVVVIALLISVILGIVLLFFLVG